jgi:hypothetical protein
MYVLSNEITRRVNLFYDRFPLFLKLPDFNMALLTTVIQLTIHSSINIRFDCSKLRLPVSAALFYPWLKESLPLRVSSCHAFQGILVQNSHNLKLKICVSCDLTQHQLGSSCIYMDTARELSPNVPVSRLKANTNVDI